MCCRKFQAWFIHDLGFPRAEIYGSYVGSVKAALNLCFQMYRPMEKSVIYLFISARSGFLFYYLFFTYEK